MEVEKLQENRAGVQPGKGWHSQASAPALLEDTHQGTKGSSFLPSNSRKVARRLET